MEIIRKIMLTAAMLFVIGSGISMGEETNAAPEAAGTEAEAAAVDIEAPADETIIEEKTELDPVFLEGDTTSDFFATPEEKIVFNVFGCDVTQRDCDAVMMYIPNRIVDFVDTFSVELGLGPRAGLNVILTRAVVTGAQIGNSANMIKGYGRQYGFAIDSGWDAHFLFTGAENTEREYTVGNVKNFWEMSQGFSTMDEDIYAGKARDYWAIGLEASLLLHAKVLIHPISIYDFFAGLIFFDPEEDDYPVSRVTY